MNTIVRKINKNQINTDIIEEAGLILKKGGLVAFPTETVYGLGADALNDKAAKKIYGAKGRPSDNPLIVHITNIEALSEITGAISREAQIIAGKYWPGPLTMIFDKSDRVPLETTGGLKTVAVRMPSHEIARRVIDAGGGYIAAPSANTSGRPSPTCARHVKEDLDGKIDMILDGGPVDIGVESTILDMTVTPPVILRPGAITKEMLEELIGQVSVDKTLLGEDSREPPKAPGMKYRHYAPKAKLVIVEGEMDSVIPQINSLAEEKSEQGYRVGIIGTTETVSLYLAGNVKNIGSRGSASSIASHLYGILREFDDDGTDYIFSESFAREGMEGAVMNRLLKASGNHVIKV